MAEHPESSDYRATDRNARRDGEDILAPRRLPAAAGAKRTMGLYLLTVLSAVDGTLIMLGASGRLDTLGGALVVGLTVIAGAGSWIAARDAFSGRRLGLRDHLSLAGLGLLTLVATTASVWLGTTLAEAMALHVMPKVAGVVLLLIGAEIAGVRLPRLHRAPLPVVVAAAGILLEVGVRWIP